MHDRRLGKKGKKKVRSIAAHPEPNTQQNGSRKTITPQDTVATESVVTASGDNNVSGPSMHVQPTFHAEEHALCSAQEKRKKPKTKTQKHKLHPTILPTHTSAASLLACPAEVLLSIIGFMKAAERPTCNRHLFQLRLVNREFRYLLQPLLFESVRIPREFYGDPPLTEDIRELLRLIDCNPSLANDIGELSYHETDPGDMIKGHYYPEEPDDSKLFLKFSRELSQASSKFVLPVHPSDKDEMSRQYNNLCAPLLLSRLTNLRKLTFHGHVGGGDALLLTPLAKQIWEYMALKSLEVLCWEPVPVDSDYDRTHWPSGEVYDYRYSLDKTMTPNNGWNVISFLRFTPALQQLSIDCEYFLARATPHNLPALQFLTVVVIEVEDPEGYGQCLLQLAKCCPVLKTMKIWHWYPHSSPPYKAVALKQALQLVQNSIEEIDINGQIEVNASATGGIGPFNDFPNLRRLSMDLMALVPVSPQGWPDNCSLLEALPPNVESLHLYIFDTIFFVSATQPIDKEAPYQFTRASRTKVKDLMQFASYWGLNAPGTFSDINDPWDTKEFQPSGIDACFDGASGLI
ncbi:hypothetical protein BZA77DRAFT_365328 [Pyronema omphalodes]|nr:hypothetical protein BZA77DRAFT_296887 [Pyronema omphalodes]KAI5817955.1 hypothetical protein BZA77DRAFT_365328 [Pyronema omphalodes]